MKMIGFNNENSTVSETAENGKLNTSTHAADVGRSEMATIASIIVALIGIVVAVAAVSFELGKRNAWEKINEVVKPSSIQILVDADDNFVAAPLSK